MKGKNQFTKEEIEELKELIALREKSGRLEQKRIRDKMRRIGFYGRDDYGINDCTVSKLENLINCGLIKMIGPSSSVKSVSKEASRCSIRKAASDAEQKSAAFVEGKDVEQKLVFGKFMPVNSVNESSVPDVPGLYCIKLRQGVTLPSKFVKIREDRIIYIGQASKSLKKRLWQEELNHKRPATFFRSIGTMLGYLPPKGSLYGKSTGNYKFCPEDTEAIKKWMRLSLMINWMPFFSENMDSVEESLIGKYCPLVNIEHNPSACAVLKEARKACVEYAKSK